MPAHFENDEKCDGSKIWASVHTMPNNLKTVRNLPVKSSLQDFDANSVNLNPKNRSVSFQNRLKMFYFHHFKVFTRCRFQDVPIRVPFSKSAGKKCAVFVWTGGLSVTFFTVFKMCRHRVNCSLSQKKLTRLAGCRIKDVWPIFKMDIWIYRSKVKMRKFCLVKSLIFKTPKLE